MREQNVSEHELCDEFVAGVSIQVLDVYLVVVVKCMKTSVRSKSSKGRCLCVTLSVCVSVGVCVIVWVCLPQLILCLGYI